MIMVHMHAAINNVSHIRNTYSIKCCLLAGGGLPCACWQVAASLVLCCVPLCFVLGPGGGPHVLVWCLCFGACLLSLPLQSSPSRTAHHASRTAHHVLPITYRTSCTAHHVPHIMYRTSRTAHHVLHITHHPWPVQSGWALG